MATVNLTDERWTETLDSDLSLELKTEAPVEREHHANLGHVSCSWFHQPALFKLTHRRSLLAGTWSQRPLSSRSLPLFIIIISIFVHVRSSVKFTICFSSNFISVLMYKLCPLHMCRRFSVWNSAVSPGACVVTHLVTRGNVQCLYCLL